MIMEVGQARQRRATKLRALIESAEKDRRRFGGTNQAIEDFGQALRSKQINASDFSVRSLFESLVEDGREIVNSWSPQSGGPQSGVQLVESGVNSSLFTQINGQIVYQTVLDAFMDPMYLASQVCPDRDTPFDGEKIAGITRLGDQADEIGEGKEYPTAGVGQEWIETPRTTKRGFIVPVTKEAVFFDRTGLILERAGEVTQWLAVNKEKRCLDAALGITSLYKRNGTSAVATYGDDSGDHDWDNLAASTGLQDWTDVETALLLFDGLTDPNTGEPINVLSNLTMIVPTALLMTALRIVNATEVRETTNSNTVTLSANPLSGRFNGQQLRMTILSSPYVKSRTSSATTWFIGNPARAFRYGVNWPITSVTAPTNSYDEFHRDIVQSFKVSERGAAEVHEPRYMVKATQ